MIDDAALAQNTSLPPTITITKLHIRYKHQWLFDQFDFCLPAKQWTCLLGPSGIGKTSLLRFIAGLPYEKHTECLGNVITSDNQPLKGKLTYMTQQDSLLPWLTILDNVLLGFYLRDKKVSSTLLEQANLLLDRVGLKHANKLRPGQLSSGMRQRVSLVRALIENRPVILMDEPFSALDTVTRLNLQALAASLLVDCTVLLVTHDPLEALRLGHKIYIISGSPAKVSYIITPQGTIPRDLSDEFLLKGQAELMKLLTTVGEPCRF